MRARRPQPPVVGARHALHRLELAVARQLDGILHGEHRGVVPGLGTEPGETRVYRPGDDVRMIDWNVTARSTVPHVRLPIADREVESWLAIDVSASMNWGTVSHTKHEVALCVATAFGLLAGRAGNRVGGALFGAGPTVVVPPRHGRQHLRALLHTVATTVQPEGGGPTDLGQALLEIGAVARRRGLVVVVSDFVAPGTWHRALGALALRHDVVAVEVVDPRELVLPDVGWLTLVDAESGAVAEVPTYDPRVRARFASAARRRRDERRQAIRLGGADLLTLATGDDWLLEVCRFVRRRRRRHAHTARARH